MARGPSRGFALQKCELNGALCLAAMGGHVEVVRYLPDREAEDDAPSPVSNMLPDEATNNGHEEVAALLRSVSAKRFVELDTTCNDPPIALNRVSINGDGWLFMCSSAPIRDGTTHVLIEPMDLMARLAALAPRPRAQWFDSMDCLHQMRNNVVTRHRCPKAPGSNIEIAKAGDARYRENLAMRRRPD